MSGGWRAFSASLFLALVVGATLAAVPCAAFYNPEPNELAGPPGSIIRYETMKGAPLGARAFRVLYRSRGLAGEPIAVSAVILIPAGSAPPGGRHVVAWGHPTTGVARRCAPSHQANAFEHVIGLGHMLGQGYIVTATDYPGLGTPGPHPYLVGASEGRAMIDSVRAARFLPGAQASNRYAVWGHSQGGHAALFAGELSRVYAPELALVGIAAAAPATDLVDLFGGELGPTGIRTITAMLLWSWSRVYNFPLSAITDAAGAANIERVAASCVDSFLDLMVVGISEWLMFSRFITGSPARVEPWRTQLIRNSPGGASLATPVLLAQGTGDNIVRPGLTDQFFVHLCRNGTPVRYLRMDNVDHLSVAASIASVAIDWISDRFNNVPAQNDCRQ
jgi:pimeloyl-ACP methyl ester carboxylesterase